MAPRRVDKEKKKLEIASAAIDLFAEKGLIDFSMNLLAQKAKIGKGTIYEYFSSREELIFAAVDLCLENLERKFSFEIKDNEEPGKALRKVSTSFILSFHNDARAQHFLIQMATMLSKSTYCEKIMDKIAQFREALRIQIEKIYKMGIKQKIYKKLTRQEIFVLSLNTVAFLDGTYSNIFISNGEHKIDELLEYHFTPLEAWLKEPKAQFLTNPGEIR